MDFIYKPKGIVKEVYLVGTMNDWNLKSHRMIETDKGVYTIKLLLHPGEYHYKFLEDGMNYVTDQNASSFIDDGFGGQNSVIIIDDNFEKVVLKKNDGFILQYGISTEQSIQTVNPLSESKIEFKTKSHRDDVGSIYLI